MHQLQKLDFIVFPFEGKLLGDSNGGLVIKHEKRGEMAGAPWGLSLLQQGGLHGLSDCELLAEPRSSGVGTV